MDDDFNDNESSSSPIWDFLKWLIGGAVAIFVVKTVAESLKEAPKDDKKQQPKTEIKDISSGWERLKEEVGLESSASEAQEIPTGQQNEEDRTRALANLGEGALGTGAVVVGGYTALVGGAKVAKGTWNMTWNPIETGNKVADKVMEGLKGIGLTEADPNKISQMSRFLEWTKLDKITKPIATFFSNPIAQKATSGLAVLGSVVNEYKTVTSTIDLASQGKGGSATAEALTGTAESVAIASKNIAFIAVADVAKDVVSLADYAITGKQNVSRGTITAAIGEAGGDALAHKAVEAVMTNTPTVEEYRTNRQKEGQEKYNSLPSDKKAIVQAWIAKAKEEKLTNIDSLGLIEVAERHQWQAPVTPPQEKPKEEIVQPK